MLTGSDAQLTKGLKPNNKIQIASAEVLAESLQGVGLAKAHRIVEYREAHGPFEHIDELAAVRGIGSATVEKNRSVIRLQ